MSTPLKILVSLATLLPLLAFGMVSVLGSDSRLPRNPEPVVVEGPASGTDDDARERRERRERQEARERREERERQARQRERREEVAQPRQQEDRSVTPDDDGVRVIPRQPRPVGDDDEDDRDADDGDDDDAGGDD